jgi:hypothetical protein
MLTLEVRGDMEATPWTQLRGGDWAMGRVVSAGLVRDGIAPGKPALALLVLLQDGRHVVAQTSLELAEQAAGYFAATDIVGAVHGISEADDAAG